MALLGRWPAPKGEVDATTTFSGQGASFTDSARSPMLSRGICSISMCVALFCSPISAAADCLKANVEGQMAQGRLTIGRAHDAAGRIERPYILHLTTDACLDSDEPDEAVKSTRTIHVFPDNDKLAPAFRRLVGKSVTVHGSPFAAMTAHHHAPIVMGVTEISAR